MSCATTIQRYLREQHIPYDTMHHPMAPTSMGTAVTCAVPPERLAKAVMLADGKGSALMAVLPAYQLKLKRLRALTGRKLHMVSEPEFVQVFGDCQPGAIPPLGMAYGVETVWDDSLAKHADMYLEAGDHETVLHVRGSDFVNIMGNAQHGSFSRHM